jgi:septum formation protein
VSRVLLASASATRAGLLKAAGVDFDVVASGVDEAPIKAALLADGSDPAEIASRLAEAKALSASMAYPDDLVVGADQTLEFEGRLFDKAGSIAEARERLAELRGRTHLLHAAVVGARAGRPLWSETVTTRLTMRDVSDPFLDAYLARNADVALWSVGAYALEGEGVQLFERIEGDYFAVLGLPLLGLLAHLRDQGLLAR